MQCELFPAFMNWHWALSQPIFPRFAQKFAVQLFSLMQVTDFSKHGSVSVIALQGGAGGGGGGDGLCLLFPQPWRTSEMKRRIAQHATA